MKRKIVFSVVFSLNILLALYIIINATSVIGGYVSSSYNMLELYENSEIDISTDSIYSTYIALYVIQIVISIFSLIYIIKENILRKKGVFAIILFILALNNLDLNIVTRILALIDIISGFCLLMLERKTEDDYPIKRKLPLLEVIQLKKYQKVCMYILIALYVILFILPTDELFKEVDRDIRQNINIAIYVLLSLFVIFIFKDKLVRDFKHLFKNFYDYFLPSAKIFALVIIVYFISSYIVHFGLNMPLPQNEEKIGMLNIWLIIFAGCIYAPIVEENIFRNSFHYIFKNNIIFVIVSSVLFGLLHTYGEGDILSIVIQAVPYSVLGFFMAYNYSKTNNIAHTMMWHAAWNLVTTILTTFIR